MLLCSFFDYLKSRARVLEAIRIFLRLVVIGRHACIHASTSREKVHDIELVKVCLIILVQVISLADLVHEIIFTPLTFV
jgi:hypothetical protein